MEAKIKRQQTQLQQGWSPLGRSQSAFEATVFSLKRPSPLTAKPRAKAPKTPAPIPESPASPSQVPPSSPPSPGALTRPSPHQRQQQSSGEGPRSSPASNPEPKPHLGDQQDSQKLPDHPLPHPEASPTLEIGGAGGHTGHRGPGAVLPSLAQRPLCIWKGAGWMELGNTVRSLALAH